MAVFTVVTTVLCATAALAAPKTIYDQRQQGELNIHAQLDNIVVVVIPSARLNLLDLAMDTKFAGEKGSFAQLLQKLSDVEHHNIIKNEEVLQSSPLGIGVVEIDTTQPIPVTTSSQQVSLHNGSKDVDKEEEVVATVEEMKADTPEKAAEPTKPDVLLTEDSSKKEETSTLDKKVQDSLIFISGPEVVKFSDEETKKEIKKSQQTLKNPTDNKKESEFKTESVHKQPEKENIPESSKNDEKEEVSVPFPKEEGTTLDFIKPVAAKEEITLAAASKQSSQDGGRKDKVIRYKPDTKWAPGLVDILGPPKYQKKELQERQMFEDLCSPGVWDVELRTCIMPGETRSRSELGRFLDAMRHGVTVPKR